MRKISILQSTYIRFYKKLLCKSKYKPKSNYKSTLRQLSRKHIIDNPQQSILKRTTAICSILLLFSSITPAEPLIASNFDLDDSFNPYLNQEDLEYNMSQVLATNEGFLIKNMPFSDSQTDERLTFQSHIVQEGESLLDVAKKYGLQVETIVWENGIVNLDDITPGHELSIPPIDGLTHTISKGENLSAIATKYRVDFYDIEKYNILNSKRLSVGTQLYIPGGTRVTKRLVANSNVIQPTPTAAKVANLATDIDASVLPNLPAPSKASPDTINSPKVPSQLKIDSIQNFSFGPGPGLNPIHTDDIVSNVLKKRAPASEGQWGRPTLGVVTQGYNKSHYALDIADTSKPPVWASASGVVEIAMYGWNGGYGNYVVINHKNGYKTLYAHNESLYVKPGDIVDKGQPIARMGRSGKVRGATGIHIHYECHKNGVRINPYKCMP
ncbi:peptidoglycan DD-metalloendopeptidase family protein [bacterium]|nr:peptidoglycan DD-metalloendopeptidase family protein [bacterium]